MAVVASVRIRVTAAKFLPTNPEGMTGARVSCSQMTFQTPNMGTSNGSHPVFIYRLTADRDIAPYSPLCQVLTPNKNKE